MKNIFVISDTHFMHENMYQFTGTDGVRIRHQFTNATEGDEAMVENWNNVVKPTDKVYHPKRIGFGVLDEHNRLIGVFSNEYFEQLVISYHQVTSSHGNQSCVKIV